MTSVFSDKNGRHLACRKEATVGQTGKGKGKWQWMMEATGV